jgi:putative hydrolase of the HAD superfamily
VSKIDRARRDIMSAMAPPGAILLDLDDTLVVDEQAAAATFAATAAHAAAAHPSLDQAALAATARRHARALWHACPDHAYWARIGMSSWEALWCRWEGPREPLPRMRGWSVDYGRLAWQRALSDQHVDDRELAADLAERYRDERRVRHLVFTDAGPALSELAAHHRLGLVTNGAACLQREKLDASGLGASFDAIVISAELGAGKPDPAVFREALRRLGDPPNATMVGDSYARDVEGALAAGLDAVWLNRPGAPRPDGAASPAAVPEIRSLSELADAIAATDDPG